MSEELVTIGHFSREIDAQIACNHLAAEGIEATVTGDLAANALWTIPTPLGVRILVHQSDVERAEEILREVREEEMSSEELMRAAGFEPEEEIEPEINPRELLALQAWKVVWVAFLFLPLQLYATYLLLRVYFRDEELSSEAKNKVLITALVNAPFALLALWLAVILIMLGLKPF